MNAPRTAADLARAPHLDEALRRASARLRAQRAGRAALTTTLAVVAILGGLILWQFVAPHAGLPLLPFGPFALALGALLLFGSVATALAFVRPVPVDGVARELDRRLELGDRAATAVALLRGDVVSPLGARVVADADATVHVALPGLNDAFPARPALATLRGLKRLTILTFVVLVGAWLAGELPVGTPLSLGLLGKGTGPDGPLPAEVASAMGTPGQATEDGTGDTDPDAPPDPARSPEPDAPRPPEPDRRPEAADAEPGVRVTAATRFERFRESEPVLVLVSGTPTSDLAAPTTYELEVTLDDQVIRIGRVLEIDPDRPEGDVQSVDLRSIPEAAARLGPGEHTLTATARPRGGGAPDTSAPVTFHTLGPEGEGGESGGGGAEPQPETAPTAGVPEPDATQPDAGTPDGPPPETPNAPAPPDDPTAGTPPPGTDDPGGEGGADAAPSPELEVAFEDRLVVPLFGAGETVTKEGTRLVLVPSDGAARRPPVPLRRALPEARKRAEAAVDRARVDPADRDLVRRYFDRLATWTE